jgi:hypothetical protein
VGSMGNSRDVKLVPELVGDIRNAVTYCQVSGATLNLGQRSNP